MSAKKNYIYNTAYSILGIITPLITAPYLSRVLGIDGIGVYSYYYAIAYYFTLMAKMGLTNYGTRHIAQVKADENKVKEAFSSIYAMQIFASAIVAVVYFFIVLFVVKKDVRVGCIFGIWVVGTVLNIDWFLFGLEKFKQTAVRSMVIRILEVVAIFLLIKSENDVWKYCLLVSIGYIVGYLILWDFGKKYILFKRVPFKDILKHLKPCLVLMIPVIALNIYRSMDKVMLGTICDMTATGLYESAEKIIYSLTMLISSLGTVMMPRMSSLLSAGKRDQVIKGIGNSLLFVSALTSAMCFGILSVSDSLIPWFYGKQYSDSIILINMLAVTLILIGWGNVVRTQYIIPNNYDPIYIKSISLGAIVNLIVNFIFIPKYAAVGACIGTLCAEFVVPVYQGLALRKELSERKYILDAIPFVLFGAIMFAVLRVMRLFMDAGFLTMLVQMVVGGIIYIVLSFIYVKLCHQDLIDNLLKSKKGR